MGNISGGKLIEIPFYAIRRRNEMRDEMNRGAHAVIVSFPFEAVEIIKEDVNGPPTIIPSSQIDAARVEITGRSRFPGFINYAGKIRPGWITIRF